MTTSDEEYAALLREERKRWKRDQRHPWVQYLRVCLNSDGKGLNLEIVELWTAFLERELEKLEPFLGDDGDEAAEDAFMELSEVYLRLVEAASRRWCRLNGKAFNKRRPDFFDPW